MKAFIVTALALCYFLPDHVEGLYEMDFDLGDNVTKCLKNLGFKGKEDKEKEQQKGKDLSKIEKGLEYYMMAYLYLSNYNTKTLVKINECIPWKNGYLNKAEKDCLRKVVPGGLKMVRFMIEDVEREFLAASDGDRQLYRRVWQCLSSGYPKKKPEYLEYTDKAVACAMEAKEWTERGVKEMDRALYHLRQTLKFFRLAFGTFSVNRALVTLNLETGAKMTFRTIDSLKGAPLIDAPAARTGMRYLPGQFHLVVKAFSRTRSVLENLLKKEGVWKEGKEKIPKRALEAAMHLGTCVVKYPKK